MDKINERQKKLVAKYRALGNPTELALHHANKEIQEEFNKRQLHDFLTQKITDAAFEHTGCKEAIDSEMTQAIVSALMPRLKLVKQRGHRENS